jgi:hypothetical protein
VAGEGEARGLSKESSKVLNPMRRWTAVACNRARCLSVQFTWLFLLGCCLWSVKEALVDGGEGDRASEKCGECGYESPYL